MKKHNFGDFLYKKLTKANKSTRLLFLTSEHFKQQSQVANKIFLKSSKIVKILRLTPWEKKRQKYFLFIYAKIALF